APRRKQHAVDAGGLGRSKEGPDVLGVLERIEGEDEWRLSALDRPCQDIGNCRISTRLHDESDALVTVESGECRQRAPFDLNDRDPEVRGVEHDPLEGRASLRSDEEAPGTS